MWDVNGSDAYYGYSDRVLETVDELGCAGDGCGCLVKFHLIIEDDAIARASWWSREIGGPGPAHEFAAVLARAAEGLTITEASKLGHLNLPHPDHSSTMVAEDAFHHALGAWTLSQMRAGTTRPLRDGSVMVAMSGGVDSAVTLHRADRTSGGDTIGCTLRLWIDPNGPDPDRACCAPDSVRRARHTCHRLGRGHISLDMRTAFHEVIVKDFIDSYSKGETPNPCVRCNGHFRLEELMKAADALGFARVATGHYVQLATKNGVVLAQRGVDANKDQSYMLSAVDPAVLARYMFPLGPDTKPVIRAEAAALGLEQAKIAGSQDLCFLGGGNYRDFLASAGAPASKSGELKLHDGTVVGSHDGIAAFTPGQRKGLGVDGARLPQSLVTDPLYVHSTDPVSGDVIVAPREQAMTRRIPLRGLRVYADASGPVHLQVRYRQGRTPLAGHLDGDYFVCDEPAFAPAPGQVAALYEGDVVIGQAFVSRDAAAAA